MVLLQCEYGEALQKLKAKGFVKRHYKIIGRGFYYEEERMAREISEQLGE